MTYSLFFQNIKTNCMSRTSRTFLHQVCIINLRKNYIKQFIRKENAVDILIAVQK